MSTGNRLRASGARRQAILDAALECFRAHGYEATTMAQIRDASGASIGSLYHHYGGKDALAAALVSEGLDSYYRAWLARLDPGNDPLSAVHSVVHGHFDWLTHNQALATVLFAHATFGELARRSPGIAGIHQRFNASLLAWIRPRIGRKGFAHLPDDVYQPLWIGPAQEVTRLWAGWESLADLAVLADQLADGAWAALRWRR